MIPLLSKTFWYQNISETQNGSPTIVFGDLRQRIRQSCDTPIVQRNFDVRTFLENRTVRPRCFPAILDKQFPTEERDTPFLSIICFRTKNFLKHRRVRPRCSSATWDKKFPTEKCDTPFFSIIFFRTRNFLKHKNVSPRSFSVLWD